MAFNARLSPLRRPRGGYKPNLAFYEALGPAGMEALRRTVASIPAGLLALGDAKRGDVDNTMRLYARALSTSMASTLSRPAPTSGVTRWRLSPGRSVACSCSAAR